MTARALTSINKQFNDCDKPFLILFDGESRDQFNVSDHTIVLHTPSVGAFVSSLFYRKDLEYFQWPSLLVHQSTHFSLGMFAYWMV